MTQQERTINVLYINNMDSIMYTYKNNIDPVMYSTITVLDTNNLDSMYTHTNNIDSKVLKAIING